MCPPGDEVYCECIEALDCDGDCITLDENLRYFRDALARTEGATVLCESAQTGRCDALRYFEFNGDIERHELRFFSGDDGRLIAMRNWTDYPAYCEGRAMTRWLGGIPRCAEMSIEATICGTTDGPPVSPPQRLDGLLRR